MNKKTKHSPNTGEKKELSAFVDGVIYGSKIKKPSQEEKIGHKLFPCHCPKCQPPKSDFPKLKKSTIGKDYKKIMESKSGERIDKAFQVWITEHDNNVLAQQKNKIYKKLKEIIADAEFAGCYDYDVIARKVIELVEKL